MHKCWAAHQAGVLADRLLALADGPGLRALPEPRSTAAQLLPNALTLAPGMHAGAYWWCFVDGDNPKVTLPIAGFLNRRRDDGSLFFSLAVFGAQLPPKTRL